MKSPSPVSPKALTTTLQFPSALKKQKKNKTCSLVHHRSRCSVAARILPKIVILLHVLHVCCSEFSEVLGATIVHIVW